MKNNIITSNTEKSIFLKVIEYGLNFPHGFKYNEFINGIELANWERKIVDQYLEAAFLNNRTSVGTKSQVDTPFFLVEMGNSQGFRHDSHTYIVSYDANFKYIDYQELKFARETAKEARKFSKVAIGISLVAFLLQF